MLTGHIQEKKGRYYMILNLHIGGKWKPKWIATGLKVKDNKRKALEMLRIKIQEYESLNKEEEMITDNDKILFSNFMVEWLGQIKCRIEEVSFISYKRVVERNIVPYFEPLEIRLVELTSKHISDYYDYLMMDRGIKASTVKHHHANIRKALQSAVYAGMIPFNPADSIEKPKVQPPVFATYQKDELLNLLRVSELSGVHLPIVLAVYYGLRSSEICGLQWNAIDFDNKTMLIKNVVTKGLDENGKEYTMKRERTKNKASYRTLPLTPLIEEKLCEKRAYIQKCQEKYRRSYNFEHADSVFTGRLGALLTPYNLSCYFRKILEKHGLRHIRFHDLRHSCASLLLSNGANMKEI